MSAAAARAALPRRIDLRLRLTAVRFQGLRQTCLAMAATAGHELLRHGTLDESLAPEFVVHGAVRRGADLRNGIRIAVARAVLTEDGQCLERLYRYDPFRDEDAPEYAPTSEAVADAASRRVPTHRVLANPTVDDARGAVAAGAATVLGLEHFGSARILGPDARVPIPDPAEPPLGGHAYLVAGYDDDRTALLVRNSWGEGWGDGGYGWLPYDYPEVFLYELWTFTL